MDYSLDRRASASEKKPKKVVSQYQAERENFRRLFGETQMLFTITRGPDHVYEFLNSAAVKLFGCDHTGQSIRDVQPELHDAGILDLLDRVYQTGKTAELTARKIPVGQDIRYFDFVYVAHRDQEGEIDGLMILANDVTTMIQTQIELKNREKQLRLITDRLPALVSYVGTDGRFHFVNKVYATWFGIPCSEILKKTRRQLLGSQLYASIAHHEENANRGGSGKFNLVLPKANGQMASVDVDYVADIDEVTGRVRGVITVGHDVTERENALQDAKRARDEVNNLLLQVPIGIGISEGPDFRLVLTNPTYHSILFGETRDLNGKTIMEAFPELSSQQIYLEKLRHVYSTGEPFIGKQIPLTVRQSNGTDKNFYIDFLFYPKRNSNGEVDGVMGIFYDVTELVVSRRILDEAVKARDEFMSIASHELRTPLTSLKLQAQISLRRLQKNDGSATHPQQVKKLSEQVDRSVSRLMHLVDDMIDSSRIANGKLSLNKDKFALSELVSEVMDRMQNQTSLIESSCSNDSLIVSADRFRIDQVLTNLLTNAIKYGLGSVIHIGCHKQDDEAVIEVRDSGRGISPEDHARIFERFERVDQSNSTGLGLGLYICKEIMGRHNGRLEVESELGHGALFRLVLPLQSVAES